MAIENPWPAAIISIVGSLIVAVPPTLIAWGAMRKSQESKEVVVASQAKLDGVHSLVNAELASWKIKMAEDMLLWKKAADEYTKLREEAAMAAGELKARDAAKLETAIRLAAEAAGKAKAEAAFGKDKLPQ